jgi:hypothetical protein
MSIQDSKEAPSDTILECYCYRNKLIYLYYLSVYYPAPPSFSIIFIEWFVGILTTVHRELSNKISSFFMCKYETSILSVCIVFGCGYF